MSLAEVWRKVKKTSQLLGRAGWRRGLRYGVAATVEHSPLMTMIHPQTIIDVGANKGQFTLFALEAWPGCRIIAYEPLPKPVAVFRRLFAGNANVELHELAVGGRAGSATMHVSNRDDSSSLLRMSEKQVTYFPGTHAIAQQEVPVIRLDQHLDPGKLGRPILLKLDVQGFEREALMGAATLLQDVDYVYVELSLEELYEKQALSKEIIVFLTDADFFLTWEQAAQTANDEVVQKDCLFSRAKSVAACRHGQANSLDESLLIARND